MKRILNACFILFAAVFVSCTTSNEQANKSKKEITTPQPILITGKNIFTAQNGSMECFHDRAGDREFDIACHVYVKLEDGSIALADFVSTNLRLDWTPPVTGELVQVSNINCTMVHSNMGYRCHLITNNVISREDAGSHVLFALKVNESELKKDLKLEDSITLSDSKNTIPPELDTVLIEESIETLYANEVSNLSENNTINSPFADSKGIGLMAVKITPPPPQPVPATSPVAAAPPAVPEWFDNLDDEGNEKISFQCNQVVSNYTEINGVVPFQIQCMLVASEELKNALGKNSAQIEGFSFPEGFASNRLACAENSAGYVCTGSVLKENLEAAKDQKPFARIELKLKNDKDYTFFTKTTALKFTSNSLQ